MKFKPDYIFSEKYLTHEALALKVNPEDTCFESVFCFLQYCIVFKKAFLH